MVRVAVAGAVHALLHRRAGVHLRCRPAAWVARVRRILSLAAAARGRLCLRHGRRRRPRAHRMGRGVGPRRSSVWPSRRPHCAALRADDGRCPCAWGRWFVAQRQLGSGRSGANLAHHPRALLRRLLFPLVVRQGRLSSACTAPPCPLLARRPRLSGVPFPLPHYVALPQARGDGRGIAQLVVSVGDSSPRGTDGYGWAARLLAQS
mmetsp:Transcript_43697/g.144699  ORF Transcript_43697/g.144699 Transcript_43697/m.144699 type:complete len:206 (-) Transcript_43697:637-1254(-)